jgi:hypothetical protein
VAHKILPIFLLVAVAFGQTTPSITNVTNAAIPGMDFPANSVALAPGSMAIIFGSDFATSTFTAAPPWQKSLGGVEVHFAEDACFDSNCELVADLIYVSPTQINFVVPSVPLYPDSHAHVWSTRIVLVKNGVRFDDRTRMLGGPGRVYIDAVYGYADSAVFGVGYECLYSYSLTDPAACNLSWSQGEHRALLGAVTDAISGQLIIADNPVHQGQILTLWMTGLTGDPWFTDKPSFCFGVAQSGKDLPSGEGWCQSANSPAMAGMWAGKSPEYPGLDQANVTFPTCSTNKKATTEKRYDVFLTFSGNTNVSQVSNGTIVRMYLPFVVRTGDPDCDWLMKVTTISLYADANPVNVGQAAVLYANVTPSTATGAVTFLEDTVVLGSGTINNGTARITTSTLGIGNHSIRAVYSGDDRFFASTSSVLTLTVKSVTPTATIALTSRPNPSALRQPVMFVATVTPATASGTVTFSELTCSPAPCSIKPVPLGTVSLSGGRATLSVSSFSADTHLISATYNGDSTYKSVISQNITQTVNKITPVVTITAEHNPYVSGQPLVLTASISPPDATGSVTFSHNGPGGTSGNLTCAGATYGISVTVVNGQAKCSTSSIPGGVGTSSITASYSGDASYSGATSPAFSLTIKQPTGVALTSNNNPSLFGQSVTFSAAEGNTNATGTMTFYDSSTVIGTSSVTGGQATFSTSALSVGNHSINAVYSGDANYGGSTSNVLTQTVNSANRTNTTSTFKVTPIPGGAILSAVVSPLTATGVVTFSDNGNAVGSATLSSQPACTSGTGQCVDTLVCLGPGSHSLTANYAGNTNYSSSASTPITITGTSITIVSASNPSAPGQPVTLMATLSPSSAGGTMWFGEGGAISCSRTPGQDVVPSPVPIECAGGVSSLSNGQFKCTTTLLSGTHSITAVYNGSGSYAGSGATVVQTVR